MKENKFIEKTDLIGEEENNMLKIGTKVKLLRHDNAEGTIVLNSKAPFSKTNCYTVKDITGIYHVCLEEDLIVV